MSSVDGAGKPTPMPQADQTAGATGDFAGATSQASTETLQSQAAAPIPKPEISIDEAKKLLLELKSLYEKSVAAMPDQKTAQQHRSEFRKFYREQVQTKSFSANKETRAIWHQIFQLQMQVTRQVRGEALPPQPAQAPPAPSLPATSVPTLKPLDSLISSTPYVSPFQQQDSTAQAPAQPGAAAPTPAPRPRTPPMPATLGSSSRPSSPASPKPPLSPKPIDLMPQAPSPPPIAPKPVQAGGVALTEDEFVKLFSLTDAQITNMSDQHFGTLLNQLEVFFRQQTSGKIQENVFALCANMMRTRFPDPKAPVPQAFELILSKLENGLILKGLFNEQAAVASVPRFSRAQINQLQEPQLLMLMNYLNLMVQTHTSNATAHKANRAALAYLEAKYGSLNAVPRSFDPVMQTMYSKAQQRK